MGKQNHWHEHYFYYNSAAVFAENHDYKDQYVTSDEEISNPNKFETAKKYYAESESLYSAAKLDSDLLTSVINDPGYNALSNDAKRLILQKKLNALRPLLVNACSASRALKLKEFEKELADCEQKLNGAKPQNTKLSSPPSVAEKEKVELWFTTMVEYLKYIFILSPANFVGWIGELNLYRMEFTFSRISWKNIWTYLKSLEVLDAESKLHGIFVNIAMMDYPAQVFNALSVLIFALKLSINLTLPFKHALAPTSRAELIFSPVKRFLMEIVRAWDTYANDIFWMIFNGITNFPLLVGLSIPVANWILVGALFFDVAVLSIVLWNEDKKLADEIAWLNKEIERHQAQLQPNNSDNAKLQAHIDMCNSMLKQAQIMRHGIRATIISCILATALFIASLALVLSLATPIMAPIGFFACVLAVAVILSRKDIGKYAEAKAAQSIFEESDSEAIKKVRAEKANKAFLQLAKSLAEFIFIPMIIVGLYTVSFPAAVAFTVIYLGVKASGIKLTGPDNPPKDFDLEEVDQSSTPLLTNSP